MDHQRKMRTQIKNGISKRNMVTTGLDKWHVQVCAGAFPHDLERSRQFKSPSNTPSKFSSNANVKNIIIL